MATSERWAACLNQAIDREARSSGIKRPSYRRIAFRAGISPAYIATLWTDDAGRRIAIFSIVWLIAGFLVLRRMARIEV